MPAMYGANQLAGRQCSSGRRSGGLVNREIARTPKPMPIATNSRQSTVHPAQ